MDKNSGRHITTASGISVTKARKVKNPILRVLMVTGGVLSISLGVVGIFLPLLPTTSFLLLAAFLFIRSSDKLYCWLMENSIFSKYLKQYINQKIIPLRVKIISMIVLWTTLLLSGTMGTDNWVIRVLLLLVGIGVSWHILSYKSNKQ